MEVETLSLLFSLLCILVDLWLTIRAIHRRSVPRLVLSLASAAICAVLFRVAWSIPLCPMCEGLTEADLGWLACWIPCEP